MVGRELAAPLSAPDRERGEPVLSMRGVGCAASGVHHVDLELCAGEIVGLAGLVGAGRTELARTLFGVTPADAGEIRLRGRTVELSTPMAVKKGSLICRRLGAWRDCERRVRHDLTLRFTNAFPSGWLRKDRSGQARIN